MLISGWLMWSIPVLKKLCVVSQSIDVEITIDLTFIRFQPHQVLHLCHSVRMQWKKYLKGKFQSLFIIGTLIWSEIIGAVLDVQECTKKKREILFVQLLNRIIFKISSHNIRYTSIWTT